MTPRGSRDGLDRAWWGAVSLVAALAVGALLVWPSLRAGHGVRFGMGIGAAVLVGICSLLGLRRRLLRFRLGSMASWAAAHGSLGALAFLLALGHAGGSLGGGLTGALLLLLGAVGLSGLVGAAVQRIVPGLMTARLSHESAGQDIPAAWRTHWGRLHDAVTGVCGPAPVAAAALASTGGEDADAARRSPPPSDPAEGGSVVLRFYEGELLGFLQRPAAGGALSQAARARLAFDGLRAGTPPALHPLVAELERTCAALRDLRAQRRYQRILRGWQLVHIPLSALTVLLLIVHILAVLFY